MRYLLGLVLIAGCSDLGSNVPKPRQAEALDLVWRQTYGQDDSPPEIWWHHGMHLFGDVDGFTWVGWKIDVADWDQDPNVAFDFPRTALAHELMHERTFERTGDVDAFHERGDWDLVDVAIWRLAKAGL